MPLKRVDTYEELDAELALQVAVPQGVRVHVMPPWGLRA